MTFEPERVFFRLMNPNNETIRPEAVAIPFQGMALTFHYYLGEWNGESASFPITRALADMMGVDTEGLFAAARENTPKLFPVKCEPLQRMCMQQVILEPEEVRPETVSQIMDSELDGAYVVTNEQMVCGAGAVLYPGILPALAKRVDDDLYLIPSSIHEMIVIPAGLQPDRSEIDKIIEAVNEVNVPDEEVLGSNCVRYLRSAGEFD